MLAEIFTEICMSRKFSQIVNLYVYAIMQHTRLTLQHGLLWPPYVIGGPLYFCPVISSSGRQPNFAALNRGRHIYSAGRPSRWALAHISSNALTLKLYF